MKFKIISILMLLVVVNLGGWELTPDNTVSKNLHGVLISVLKYSDLNRSIPEVKDKWEPIHYPKQGVVGLSSGSTISLYTSYLQNVEDNFTFSALRLTPDNKYPFENPFTDFSALDAQTAAEMMKNVSESKIRGLMSLRTSEQEKWLIKNGEWYSVFILDNGIKTQRIVKGKITRQTINFSHLLSPKCVEWLDPEEIVWNEGGRLVWGNILTHSQRDLDSDLFDNIESISRNPQDHTKLAIVGRKEGQLKLLVYDWVKRESQLLSGDQAKVTAVSWSPDGTKIAWLNQEKANVTLIMSNLETGSTARQTLEKQNEAGIAPVIWAPDALSLFMADGNSLLKIRMSDGSTVKISLPFSGGKLSSVNKLAFSVSAIDYLDSTLFIYLDGTVDGSKNIYSVPLETKVLRFIQLDASAFPKATNHNYVKHWNDIPTIAKHYGEYILKQKETEEHFYIIFDYQEEYLSLPPAKFNPSGYQFFPFNCSQQRFESIDQHYISVEKESLKKLSDNFRILITLSQNESRRTSQIAQRDVLRNPKYEYAHEFNVWGEGINKFLTQRDLVYEEYLNAVADINQQVEDVAVLSEKFGSFIESKHPAMLTLAKEINDTEGKLFSVVVEKYSEAVQNTFIKMTANDMNWIRSKARARIDEVKFSMLQFGDIDDCDYETAYDRIFSEGKKIASALELIDKLQKMPPADQEAFKANRKYIRQATLSYLNMIKPLYQLIDPDNYSQSGLEALLQEFGSDTELWFWQYNQLVSAWASFQKTM